MARDRQPLSGNDFGPWELNRVHNADALAGLKQVPSDVFDVAVTSPPYWGQRGSQGLGSEPDPRDYVQNLVEMSPKRYAA